jgi:hypothetical protein
MVIHGGYCSHNVWLVYWYFVIHWPLPYDNHKHKNMVASCPCILKKDSHLCYVWTHLISSIQKSSMYQKNVANNNWLNLKSDGKHKLGVNFWYAIIYLSFVKKWWCMECIVCAPHVSGVKVHYGEAKIVVTLYCFLGVPCLNFNHVIILKDFHNVFAYYGRSKPKQVKFQENYTFNLIWCDVKIHLCQKNIH